MNHVNVELLFAVEERDLERVRECIQRGADINSEGEDGTALMLAVYPDTPFLRRKPIIEFLLAKGARVDARNDEGGTALMACALNGAYRDMELLIQSGANPHLVDSDGQNALHYAALNSLQGRSTEFAMVRAAKCLVQAGVSTTHRDRWGHSPIEVVSKNFRDESVFVSTVITAQAAYVRNQLKVGLGKRTRAKKRARVM